MASATIISEKDLEERISLLQEKISHSEGELISALTRYYKQLSHGQNPEWYVHAKNLHVGLIISKTKIALEEMVPPFIEEIKTLYWVEINSGENNFLREVDNGFYDVNVGIGKFLFYKMDEPPEFPRDATESGCFGSHSTVSPIEKPRLELFVGDAKTIPVLQENLEGWKYLQLSERLCYELPITKEMEKKITDEQLRLIEQIRKVEKSSGNAKWLIERGINRGYHEKGRVINKELEKGIMTTINVKTYFANQKIKYKL